MAVQLQNQIPALWVEVDPDSEMRSVVIRIFGTGEEFEQIDNVDWDLSYIDTVQWGQLVLHVYIVYEDLL